MSTDAGIYFQGWIHKKNDNKIIGDKWNKRWFVLYEDGILAYYASQVLDEIKNSLNLRGSKLKVLPIKHINKKHPYCFELATKKRTFLLSCLNEKEYRSWMYWLSKGHPDAPLERSGTFYNTVIEQVLQEAEELKERRSLTRRLTEAAENSFRERVKVHSAPEGKMADQQMIKIFDSKPKAHRSVEKSNALSLTSPKSLESLKPDSGPYEYCDSKEDEAISAPIANIDFVNKIQEFVIENEQKMEEVIQYLVRSFDENESKATTK